MRLLLFEFNGGVINSADIRQTLQKKGIDFAQASYCFSDTCRDDFFSWRFAKLLDEVKPDAVFSINYFPLVAGCCHEKGLKYLAWSFDCPLNAERVEETLALPTNYVFLFDREHVKSYRGKGFDNVYHLPLAVNCERLDAIRLTEAERERYGADITFVGRFYDSQLPAFTSRMKDYDRGYIEALCEAQTELYGCFLADSPEVDELVERVNACFRERAALDPALRLPEDPLTGRAGGAVQINKEWLGYEISKVVTRTERLRLIKVLSGLSDMKLYSTECPAVLDRVRFMGTCDGVNELPRVFKASSINLHTTLRCIRSGIPQRIVEILGAGGLCLTNYQPELMEYFENGRDLVIYDSTADAYEKASYLLNHPDEAEAIRKNGHAKAVEYFSYEERFDTMLRRADL